MAPGPADDAQIVQAAGNRNDRIGQSSGDVTELVFRNATDFHSGDDVLHAHTRPSQETIMSRLTGLQFRVLRFFFGWRCARTVGA